MHPAIEQHAWTERGLMLGGRAATTLAAEAGQTPFFVYDFNLVERRFSQLRKHLPDALSVSYAVKANPMLPLVTRIGGLVDGFDVASAGEMRIAIDAGMGRESISFAGPGKTNTELAQAIAAGIVLEIESEGELARALRIGDAAGIAPNIAVRINPDFSVKASGMRMGGGAQQFGIDAERVPAVLSELGGSKAVFHGLHVFPGSQNLQADILAEAYERIANLAIRIGRESPSAPTRINLGGGFGIPYFPNETALDLDALAPVLCRVAARLRDAFPGVDLRVELGRYLVGEAGVYFTRVVERKVSRGKTYLVTDGGLHHQLAASGNFGQRIRRNFPVAAAGPYNGPEETVTVVGCLCTPLDLLGDEVVLPRLEPGDLIAVFQAGAYGLTASPTGFLGHPAPLEMLV
jgi:diaminopimelate decarboxylase